MELSFFSYIAIILYVVLSICVTAFLITREELEPFQKGAQIFLVWLIPYFAAISLWLLNREKPAPKPSKKPFGGGPQDSGVAGGE
ncbi:MAG: hypothetical protein CMI05_00855 [Oceanospirillaceae bacterium]|nr:hypothetical protein [Oceanospirillaceae bacterium]|tara:strand:+ start:990 stop:1244 length:255 start_codon:yes stop_codon:yes gene_type:complete